jgi:hypothetical protein
MVFCMSVLAGLPRSIRYAIFAFPTAVTLLFGALYLAYSAIVCDPLYADDAESAGYKSGSAVSALRALMPAGFEGDKTMPAPRRSFGVACWRTPQ